MKVCGNNLDKAKELIKKHANLILNNTGVYCLIENQNYLNELIQEYGYQIDGCIIDKYESGYENIVSVPLTVRGFENEFMLVALGKIEYFKYVGGITAVINNWIEEERRQASGEVFFLDMEDFFNRIGKPEEYLSKREFYDNHNFWVTKMEHPARDEQDVEQDFLTMNVTFNYERKE